MRVNKGKSIFTITLMFLILLASVFFFRLSFFEVRATVAHANAKAREAADLWSETQSLLLAADNKSATEKWEATEGAIRDLTELRMLKGLGMLDPELKESRLELLDLSTSLARHFPAAFSSDGRPGTEIEQLTHTLQVISQAITDYSDNQSLYFQNLLLFAALLLLSGIFVLVVVEQRNRALLKAEQRARNLSRYLISDYEKSMHSIALDLHDDIAQNLCLIRMESDRSLREELLDQTIGKIRRLSYDIRPGKAASMPLAWGLRSLLSETTEKTGWAGHFTETGLKPLRLPYEVRIHLYRIVQEALTNIRKHAAATSVTVKAVCSYPVLKISICDDGRGFDPGAVDDRKEEGMGLRGMRERIEIIGGRLNIQSRPTEGTTLQIELNIEEYLHGTD